MVIDGAAIGTNRLAIVDRDQAKQPVVDLVSRKMIVMNGEIYNYNELRFELEKKGRKLTSGSDTEVALQAYLEWGPNSVFRLMEFLGS